MPVPVVIDCDLGTDVDDALALIFALASPEIDVRAVLVSHGNVDLRARLAARLLALAGRVDIPVLRGADRPLRGSRRPAMLGHEGIGVLDCAALGPDAPILEQSAAAWLRDRWTSGPLTVLALGPLTNLALALDARPTDGGNLRAIVMGGMLNPSRYPPSWVGLINNPLFGPEWFDHNTQCDPEASLRCARAGIITRWVTIEVTTHILLRREHVARLFASSQPLSTALQAMVAHWNLPRRFDIGLGSPIPTDGLALLHDPLTVATLIREDLVEYSNVPLSYSVNGGLFHLQQLPPQANTPVVEVSSGVHAEEMLAFFVQRVGDYLLRS